MGRGPEAKIQDAVLKYAKSRGLLYKKNEVGRYFVASGWPDVEFYPHGGKSFFMEFKAPGARPTPLQEHRISELRGAGYQVYVVNDAGLGKASIDREIDEI